MGILNLGKQILKTTVRAALTPVEMAKDVFDMDKPGPTHTGKHLSKLAEDFKEIPESLDD